MQEKNIDPKATKRPRKNIGKDAKREIKKPALDEKVIEIKRVTKVV